MHRAPRFSPQHRNLRSENRHFVWLIAALCAVLPGIAMGQTVSNQDPSFTLRLPPGFVRQTPPAGMLYAYARAGDKQTPPAAIVIELLEGELGEDLVGLPPDAPRGSSLSFVRWRDCSLQVNCERKEMLGGTLVGRAVRIPLVGKGIQVNLMMPANQAAQIDQTLAEVLDGVDGEISWPADRRKALALSMTKWACVAVAGALIAWKIFRRRPEPPPIYAAG